MLRKTARSRAGKSIPFTFDEDGFLVESKMWTKSVSRTIAELDGIELTHEHLAIIYYLREHYLSYGALPPVSQTCRTLGMGKEAVQRLFGGSREAWRIAGQPNPGIEALSYM